MKTRQKKTSKGMKKVAYMALVALLSTYAVSDVYGNETDTMDMSEISTSMMKLSSKINGTDSDVLDGPEFVLTIGKDIKNIINAKTSDEKITEACRLLLHVSTTALGSLIEKPEVGELISNLGDHALDHPEDNGFAILVNWFYDNSSIPEKITEWYYDVRYGDTDTRIKRLEELAILISDSNPQTKILSPLLKEIMERLESLRKSDLKYFDPSLVTPFDEIPSDISGPTSNPTPVPDSDGRFQGLKPIKLL